MNVHDKDRLYDLLKAFLSSGAQSVNYTDFKAKLESIIDIYEKHLETK